MDGPNDPLSYIFYAVLVSLFVYFHMRDPMDWSFQRSSNKN